MGVCGLRRHAAVATPERGVNQEYIEMAVRMKPVRRLVKAQSPRSPQAVLFLTFDAGLPPLRVMTDAAVDDSNGRFHASHGPRLPTSM